MDLGAGVRLRSAGKMALEEYAQLMRESAVGLSLMVSPHPSYPPLEMAHFGMRVVTNGFADKDLSRWHENIHSLRDCSPESVAAALGGCCDAVETNPAAGPRGRSLVPEYLSDAPPFPFVGEIVRMLRKAGIAVERLPGEAPALP